MATSFRSLHMQCCPLSYAANLLLDGEKQDSLHSEVVIYKKSREGGQSLSHFYSLHHELGMQNVLFSQ